MIENIAELQELIEWCKATGVKSLKISDVEFELSDLAISERFMDTQTSTLKDRESSSLTSDTMADAVEDPKKQQEEDDDLLFWSSR